MIQLKCIMWKQVLHDQTASDGWILSKHTTHSSCPLLMSQINFSRCEKFTESILFCRCFGINSFASAFSDGIFDDCRGMNTGAVADNFEFFTQLNRSFAILIHFWVFSILLCVSKQVLFVSVFAIVDWKLKMAWSPIGHNNVFKISYSHIGATYTARIEVNMVQ